MNYVKELKPYLMHFGKDILSLYWATGEERSPIFPLLNYAAMSKLLNGKASHIVTDMGLSFSNFAECKKAGLECMKEHMSCFILPKDTYNGVTIIIPTYEGGSDSIPFDVLKTKSAYFSSTGITRTLMSEGNYEKEVPQYFLNSRIYELVAGLNAFLYHDFGETIMSYRKHVVELPSLKELCRAVKDTRNVPLTIPNSDKHATMNHMARLFVAQNGKEEFVCQSRLLGEKIIVQYIMPQRREIIYFAHNIFTIKHFTTDDFYRGYNPIESPDIRKVLPLYEKCLNELHEYADAMTEQRQKLLEMCNND